MKHTLTILPVISTCLLASVGSVHAADAPPSSKPNIVYILADDLGYGDVKCFGGERSKIPTPNIDRLASQGMIFTESHSSSAVCTPTRYGILTGRYNWRSPLQKGVLDNYVAPLIAPDRLTVPALLKQNGYHTACIGKWHLGFTIQGGGKKKNKGKMAGAPLGARTADGPITRGFDLFYGFHHARMMKSVFLNDRVVEIIEPVDMLPKLVQHASDYIDERAKSGTPFFLYLAINSPHTPIVPSAAWRGKSPLGKYGDYVMETDWAAGQVVDAVTKAGIADNTLIIFTSDNGCSPEAGVKHLEHMEHFPSEQRRGYKADIWDGGHRIPFIARWPGKIKPGSRSDEIICLTDLMATSAEIIGAQLPDTAGVDSVSILQVLLGTAKKPVREAVVHHSISGKFAIRQGQWKLELCPDSGGWSKSAPVKTPGQLYDMRKDVGERANEYSQHPEIVSRLTKLLEKYVAEGRSTAGPAQKNDVPVDIWKKNSKDKNETE
jgi:arylsulfatase A